jgi:outer membrane lipase/esterase
MINTAANQAADQLEKLLAAGAKDIVVPNMIPYSLSPYFSSNFPAPVGVIFDGSIESNYNQVFSQRLAEMRADYPDANLYNLDWFDLVKDVAANPTGHGLENGTSRLPAGADPETYFWYDDLHPSSGGHEILAQYAYDEIIASLQIPEPSISALGSLVFAAGCFRRSRILAA